MKEIGNPFSEDSSNLLVLDSHNIADAVFSATISKIERVGLEQYNKFVKERLLNGFHINH